MHQQTISSRKQFFSKVAMALTAFHPRGRKLDPPIDTKALHAHRDAEKPLEEAWNPQCFKYGEDHYSAFPFRSETGDGVWICCCRHKNILMLYQGAYPFKYVQCAHCEHILCPHCRTSDDLTPIPSITTEAFEERIREQVQEVRYYRLCRACGLTQPGTIKDSRMEYPSPCPCNQPAIEEGSHFFISTVDGYRDDPNGTAVNLGLERSLAASQRYLEMKPSVEVPVPGVPPPMDFSCPPPRTAQSTPVVARTTTQEFELTATEKTQMASKEAKRARRVGGFWCPE